MAQPFLEENPLTFELRTLRDSVARFQEEAHTSGVKLQRYSLDSTKLYERTMHLERENDILKAELAVLRANPHPDGSSNADTHGQVQELTLALRKLSHRITLTEDALLVKTTELICAQADTIKAKASAEGAYELGARVRGREEAALARERELQNRIAQLEEDGRMADVALNEYAALVREMENRRSSGVTKNSVDGVVPEEGPSISTIASEGKLAHSKLLQQFKAEISQLQSETRRLNSELDVMKALLKAEAECTTALTQELGSSKAALENLQLEDNTAAKMVSRYMQFSQISTNDLLSKLSALKVRHEGTLNTLTSQSHALSVQLRVSEAHVNHLLHILDELGGEIMKEAWGRRREVGLRIRMGGREERVVESIRRWVRKGEELLSRIHDSNQANGNAATLPDASLEALLTMAQDARILLASLDEGAFDEELGMSLSGSKARLLLTGIQIDSLLDELKDETEKRLSLQKQLVASNAAVQNRLVSTSRVVPEEENDENIHPHAPLDDTDLPPIEEDRPPKVPEKSAVHPPLPDVLPSLPDMLSGISSNECDSTTCDPPPQPSIATPELLQSGQEPSLRDKTVTTGNDIRITPFRPSETPSLSTYGRPIPAPTNDSFLDSATLVSIQLEASETSLRDKESEPSGDVDHQNVLAISVETLNTNTPAVPTVDEPHFVFVFPAGSIMNNESKKSQQLSTLSALEHDKETLPPGVAEGAPSTPSLEGQCLDPKISSPAVEIVELPSSSADTTHVPSPPPTPSAPTPPSNAQPSSPSPFASTKTTYLSTVTRPHPLLNDLVRVTKRYDDLQCAFRDCHLALEALKAELRESPVLHFSAHSTDSSVIPSEILNAALGRLDDYTEDARVELEIRVGDEALLAKGYEALLSVPGAIDAASLSSSDDQDTQNKREHTQLEVEQQISDFVSGADSAVRRARDTFTRKLEDVQHDIAVLKRAIHDPTSFTLPQPHSIHSHTTPSSLTSSLVSPAPLTTELDNQPGSAASHSVGWTSWIRSSSRSASPAPPTHGPSPTFGNIMTAPRLRHAPSSGSLQPASASPNPSPVRSRRSSFFGLGVAAPSEPPPSPLAALELRVPMPSFPGGGGAFANTYGGMLSPASPLKSAGMAPTTRVRTVSSTMYMLGLGAGSSGAGAAVGGRMVRAASASGHLNTPASPLRSAFSRSGHSVPLSGLGDAASPAKIPSEREEETGEEEDTDVE